MNTDKMNSQEENKNTWTKYHRDFKEDFKEDIFSTFKFHCEKGCEKPSVSCGYCLILPQPVTASTGEKEEKGAREVVDEFLNILEPWFHPDNKFLHFLLYYLPIHNSFYVPH